MPVKISEKNFFAGIFCLVVGLALLLGTSVVKTPARVAERDLLFLLIALALIVESIFLFRRSVHEL